MLSLRRLSRANRQRCEENSSSLDEWSPTDWATALAGKTGDVCNLIVKMRKGDKIDPNDVGREIADLVIYADLLSSRLGIDLEKAVVQKFNESSTRQGSEVLL